MGRALGVKLSTFIFALMSVFAEASICMDSFAYEVNETTVRVGLFHRKVSWAFPKGNPPRGGWPVAMVYQGTGAPVGFSKPRVTIGGRLYQYQTIRDLLDAGIAVMIPRPRFNYAWDTNTVPLYRASGDYAIFKKLFSMINDGEFGPLNGNKKFAFGISSGGYNTSRMAVSFPGEFIALAIESAGYATNGGVVGLVPRRMPEDHPPTLFLHGKRDFITPYFKMEIYANRLAEAGVPVEILEDPEAGHEHLKESPTAILEWFLRYL